MIRPTRKSVLAFAALLPLPWLALVYRPGLWPLAFNLSALVLIAMATDAALAYPRHRVAVEVSTPNTGYIGDVVEATVSVRTGRQGRPTQFEMTMDVKGDAQPELTANSFMLDRPSETIRIVPRRRGMMQIENVWLRWTGPFGLVQQTRRFVIGRTIRILPNVHAARTASLDFFSRNAAFGMKIQLDKGEGSEFEALREYAPGLDTRFIDWKHSARHRKLLTKEFRTERNHPIVLAYDTGHLMHEPLEGVTRLDHSINSGLLLAWLALRSGDLVGSCAFDGRVRQYLSPTRGLRSFRHLQQSSADLAYGEDETNFTIAAAELHMRLTRRALVVIFTEFVDVVTAELLLDSVERLTTRHLLIFVTFRDPLLTSTFDQDPKDVQQIARSVIANDFERDRSIVLQKLSRMGVHCLDVAPKRLSASLLNRYLLIKQRGLL